MVLNGVIRANMPKTANEKNVTIDISDNRTCQDGCMSGKMCATTNNAVKVTVLLLKLYELLLNGVMWFEVP
jgi:hypothetical protein